MQIRREEIRTGLLVLVSVAIITAVLLALGAPGVFKPVNTYHIFFDNAGGIKLGAPVLLAGRKIGQVTKLSSPVPLADRPKPEQGKPEYEALIEVRVDRDAQIYNNVQVRMVQYSLLGEQVIDFSSGDESTGAAKNGTYFKGERQKDFSASIAEAVDVVKNVVTPVAQEAEKTMAQLRDTASSLKDMTQPGGNIDQAIVNFRDFGHNLVEISGSNGKIQLTLDNLQTLTGPNGHLHDAIENIDKLTTDLAKNKNIEISLQNFRQASDQLKSTMSSLSPDLTQAGHNIQQFSDTVKREPWRLIWHSQKQYPEDNAQPQPVRRRR